jgi:hypothetical protein
MYVTLFRCLCRWRYVLQVTSSSLPPEFIESFHSFVSYSSPPRERWSPRHDLCAPPAPQSPLLAPRRRQRRQYQGRVYPALVHHHRRHELLQRQRPGCGRRCRPPTHAHAHGLFCRGTPRSSRCGSAPPPPQAAAEPPGSRREPGEHVLVPAAQDHLVVDDNSKMKKT